MATFGSIRLREVSTASIASGYAVPFDFLGAVFRHETDDDAAYYRCHDDP